MQFITDLLLITKMKKTWTKIQ